ncbi:hypothetical protein [Kribbella sp. VKM Ac-2568]|uniref:hypothetical protein n=1 Tax=Kribbella sp. VKM Ac-2568 TaxID=2512219 RepID=UPI001049C924|nr:hypothetical protein [Kribbella sp. VKM Ac-2568]
MGDAVGDVVVDVMVGAGTLTATGPGRFWSPWRTATAPEAPTITRAAQTTVMLDRLLLATG